MPTYQYECEQCWYQFEKFQSYSEVALTQCPKCNTNSLRKLFGTGICYVKGSKGFTMADICPQNVKEVKSLEEETSKSEFGAAKNFLDRWEQVEKANEEIERNQAT